MMFYIMVPINLFVLLMMYFSTKAMATSSPNLIFGIAIPKENLKAQEFNNIIESYKKQCKKLMWVLLPLQLTGFIFKDLIAISMIYLMVLLAIIIGSFNYLFYKASKQVKAIKIKNEWYVKTQKAVLIDTELARLQSTFPIKLKWFLPADIILIVLLVLFYNAENFYYQLVAFILIITSLITAVFFYYLSFKTQNKVYSSDTAINLALNKNYKRGLSEISVVTAYATLFFAPLLIQSSGNVNTNAYTTTLFICIALHSIVTVFAVLIVQNKNIKLKQKLLSSNSIIYEDDSDYYKFGYYYNPNVNKTFVPKQLGYGSTINVATTGGKVFAGIIGAIIIGTVALMFSLIGYDLGTITLTESDTTFEISEPGVFYSISLQKDEITSVEIVDEINATWRVNGAATDRISVGNFAVDGYGTAKLYIMNNVKQYIKIEMQNGEVIFLNGETEELTLTYYEMLSENIMV